jgi:hypothetical protein
LERLVTARQVVVEHVSWLIYARRCERRTRWRKLSRFRQAQLALAHLRKNETLAQLSAWFGVSEATAGGTWRRSTSSPPGRPACARP